MIIAITGAAGQVGRAVTRSALHQGHTVLALDLPEVGTIDITHERYTYRQVNAANFPAFKHAVEQMGCDALIHLAAMFNVDDVKGDSTPGLGEHDVHNTNISMSYNALTIAAQLGINRVVIASSVNSIGMVFSKRPRFDYLPLDEDHPFYPEDAYSVSKYICEIQSSAFARRIPSLRIATLRLHYVCPPHLYTASHLSTRNGAWKDLWGYVSESGAASACLLALTAPVKTFPVGHETFFIVAGRGSLGRDSEEVVRARFVVGGEWDGRDAGGGKGWVGEIRTLARQKEAEEDGKAKGNWGFVDCGKACRMLGWEEDGFVWSE